MFYLHRASLYHDMKLQNRTHGKSFRFRIHINRNKIIWKIQHGRNLI